MVCVGGCEPKCLSNFSRDSFENIRSKVVTRAAEVYVGTRVQEVFTFKYLSYACIDDTYTNHLWLVPTATLTKGYLGSTVPQSST